MKYHVTHTTRYRASERVSVCHNAAWLTPRNTSFQRLEQHEVSITPPPSVTDFREDIFGNRVTHFSFNEGYNELRVTASSHVEVSATVRTGPSPDWEAIRDRLLARQNSADLEAMQFVFSSPCSRTSAEAAAYGRISFAAQRPILECIADLTSRIFQDFEYDPRATTVTTPVDEVLHLRRGVCQDFAHVQIATLRSLGLAARYVSGYVRTTPQPGQPRLVGADASHAWLSVYCGDLGWIDVDPTNDRFVGDEYITVAWGRDYADVVPLKGVYTGGGSHLLDVSVDVVPLSTAFS